ncbi:DUF1819 family protein [Paratractidigestivibacter sp.]|uniref:DUF1819 family protein n=1 Tax=Paratractidigestivibacter sp. TaxID=2847316 RepID=UPI002AC99CCD|nr:DUF1819 family protein [Paratractidigestivibacter sp.]
MPTKYALSYTAAGLRRVETQTLAREHRSTPDWAELRRRAIDEDLLMIRQVSSRKRVSGELIKRLRNLTPAELEALASADDARVAEALCWLAICRTYDFVAAFAVNVAGSRWHDGVTTLTDGVYEDFYAQQSELHPELASISDQTRARLRSQLFTIMREMGFLQKDGTLTAYQLPPAAAGLVCEADLALFPTAVA